MSDPIKVFSIYWCCYLPRVVHCREGVIKYHMVMRRGSHLWCSNLVPLALRKIGSVQGRIQSLPLVTILVALVSLTAGGALGRVLNIPRCGILSEIFETPLL